MLGLLVVAAGAWRARLRIVDGVVEAHGPALAWMLAHLTLLAGGVSALTLGHVVVARDALALDATRAHERVHVDQYEAWGPLFVPAYVAASLAAVVRGHHFYYGNRFELEAFASDCPASRAWSSLGPTHRVWDYVQRRSISADPIGSQHGARGNDRR